MYISFMQEVLGVSPVTFEERLFFLMIALVLIAMMEVYKFCGKIPEQIGRRSISVRVLNGGVLKKSH